MSKGKVLFVDDEKSILRSLRRAFFQSDFDVLIAHGGHKAIELLKQEKDVDILVTDIRMPEISGLELLNHVKKEYPSIHRIVLSGFVEEKTVLSALNSGLAITYFAKPWVDKILEKRITHLLELRNSLQDKNLLSLLSQINNFPTFPTLYLELVQTIEQEKNVSEIVDIIQKDVAATSKILQVANSAFFGNRKVTSLHQAIVRIGLMAVRNIFLTLSIVSQMDWTKSKVKHLEKIFEHSYNVNRFTNIIYHIVTSQEIPQKYSSVGIVHDLGKIILLQYFADNYHEILELYNQYPLLDFYDCELELGFKGRTHCEIGAYFIDNWNLPQSFSEAALYHHDMKHVSEDDKTFFEIFRFTDNLLSYMERIDFDLNADYTEFKGLDLTNKQFENIIQRIKREINE